MSPCWYAGHCTGPPDALECRCDVMEVPGNEVYAPYEILPDRYYATWAPATGEYGTVMAGKPPPALGVLARA